MALRFTGIHLIFHLMLLGISTPSRTSWDDDTPERSKWDILESPASYKSERREKRYLLCIVVLLFCFIL